MLELTSHIKLIHQCAFVFSSKTLSSWSLLKFRVTNRVHRDVASTIVDFIIGNTEGARLLATDVDRLSALYRTSVNQVSDAATQVWVGLCE